MKNLFKRLRSWHTENRKYEGFVMMELWTAMLIFTLVVIVCRLSHDFFAWNHAFLSFFMVSFNAVPWLHNKEKAKLHKFYEELLRHAHESASAAIENYVQYQRWLVSANRRRKRAERKLKKQQEMYRYAMSRNVELLHKVYEYESVLLDANLAMADISSCPILPDTAAMAEAQQRFKAYMKIHYAEIAKRQFNRELKKSAFGCLFFGDANGDPKDSYSGIFGGEDFSSTENKANQP